MTTAPEIPLCDPIAMTRFHRIFREALAAAPEYVGSAVDEDRVELVGSYYFNVLKLLHGHHEAEDLTIYPLMLERLPEFHDILTRVNAEHETVLGALEAAEASLEAWRADPSEETRRAAVEGLQALEPVLMEHLDDEEAEIVPLIGQVINVAEWGEMSSIAFQHFRGDKPWLIIGLIQEQMLDHENAMMEANMPPPVHDMWMGSGRAMFGDFVTSLR